MSSSHSTDMYEIDYTFLFLFFFLFFFTSSFYPQSNLEEEGDALHQLGLNRIYKYTCQRDICFLLSKVNNQSHLISNLSHMLCGHHHKYKRI